MLIKVLVFYIKLLSIFMPYLSNKVYTQTYKAKLNIDKLGYFAKKTQDYICDSK